MYIHTHTHTHKYDICMVFLQYESYYAPLKILDPRKLYHMWSKSTVVLRYVSSYGHLSKTARKICKSLLQKNIINIILKMYP